MRRISNDEMNFIKSILKDSTRIDSRDINDEREISYSTDLCPQADLSIRISKGNTTIEIIIKYKENEETLKELNLAENSIKKDIEGNIHYKGNFFFKITTYIEELLKQFKLGFVMEMNVLCDDGNIHGAFFDGLGILFSRFCVPDIHDLSKETVVCKLLPACKTFAVFEEIVVVDPNLKEELSADSIVNIFHYNNNMVGFKVEKSKKLDPFTLSSILSSFN